MKVSTHIKNMKEAMPPDLADLLLSETSIWTNEACYGYCIEALENAGYAREQIDEILHHLHNAFDSMGVEDAEAKWHSY